VAEVRRVTWVGLVLNLFLSALKVTAGILGSSQAIVADGIHSLSDMSTDITILIGVRYWMAPADENHPYGHRRIETVITAILGILVGTVALGLAYNAIATIKGRHLTPPGWIALAAALISMISKEILYRWTIATGKRINSPAVIANAWHHRSDALSSIPPAIAVGSAMLFSSWLFLDHIGALVVTVFILQAAWRIARPALGELVDTGAPKEVRDEIEAIVLGTDEVKHVHAIRTRRIGTGIQVDLHIHVDGSLSVKDGHEVSGAVKRRLLSHGPDIVDVVVHLEPCEEEERHASGLS
jgi:cation diffusion facilitator family transporter